MATSSECARSAIALLCLFILQHVVTMKSGLGDCREIT
jgi:hypothetical protein